MPQDPNAYARQQQANQNAAHARQQAQQRQNEAGWWVNQQRQQEARARQGLPPETASGSTGSDIAIAAAVVMGANALFWTLMIVVPTGGFLLLAAIGFLIS